MVNINDSLSYKDLTSGATRWKWDFGDDEFSDKRDGKHIYLQTGKFNVVLTVYGSFGVLKSNPNAINVITPITSAKPQIIGSENVKVNDSANYECSTTAESYEWYIKDMPKSENQLQNSRTAKFAFSSAGKHTIVLSIHNPEHIISKDVDIISGAVVERKPAIPHRHRSKGNHHGLDWFDHGKGVEAGRR